MPLASNNGCNTTQSMTTNQLSQFPSPIRQVFRDLDATPLLQVDFQAFVDKVVKLASDASLTNDLFFQAGTLLSQKLRQATEDNHGLADWEKFISMMCCDSPTHGMQCHVKCAISGDYGKENKLLSLQIVHSVLLLLHSYNTTNICSGDAVSLIQSSSFFPSLLPLGLDVTQPWEVRREVLYIHGIVVVLKPYDSELTHCLWKLFNSILVSDAASTMMPMRLGCVDAGVSFLCKYNTLVLNYVNQESEPPFTDSVVHQTAARILVLLFSELAYGDAQTEQVFMKLFSKSDIWSVTEHLNSWRTLYLKAVTVVTESLHKNDASKDSTIPATIVASAVTGMSRLICHENKSSMSISSNIMKTFEFSEYYETVVEGLCEYIAPSSADHNIVVFHESIQSIARVWGIKGMLMLSETVAKSQNNALASALPVYVKGIEKEQQLESCSSSISNETFCKLIVVLCNVATIPKNSVLQDWMQHSIDSAECEQFANRAKHAFDSINHLVHWVQGINGVSMRLSWEVESEFFIVCTSWTEIGPNVPWFSKDTQIAASQCIVSMANVSQRHNVSASAAELVTFFVANRLDKLVQQLHSSLAGGTWISNEWTKGLAFLGVASYATRPLLGGDCLTQMLSVLLPMCEVLDKRIATVALKAMSHVVQEVLPTEVRWHDVVLFSMLNKCLSTRETQILAPAIATLDASLQAIEPLSPPPGLGSRHHKYLVQFLDDLTLSTETTRSTLLLTGIRLIVTRMASECIPLLGKLLPAASEGVSHGQVPVRFHALRLLETLVKTCWIRVPNFVEVLGSALIRGYLISLSTGNTGGGVGEDLPEMVTLNNDVLERIELLLCTIVRLCPENGSQVVLLRDGIGKIVQVAIEGPWGEHKLRLDALLGMLE